MIRAFLFGNLIFLFSIKTYSQKPMSHWSIGVNPLSLAESQLSLGPCIGYRINERYQFWGEVSYIFANAYMLDEWTNMKGFRFILQARRFSPHNKTFFIAPEFRIKNYSFNNKLNFENDQTSDTLYNYAFRETQLLIGGALVFGKKIFLSKRHKNFLELTLGFGLKQRFINRHVPVGYVHYIYAKDIVALYPTYEYDRLGTFYLPFSCRFYWQL